MLAKPPVFVSGRTAQPGGIHAHRPTGIVHHVKIIGNGIAAVEADFPMMVLGEECRTLAYKQEDNAYTCPPDSPPVILPFPHTTLTLIL